MAIDRIDSVIDTAAVKLEIDGLKKNLTEIKNSILEIPKAKLELTGAEGVRDYSKSLTKLQEETAKINKLVAERVQSEAKLVAVQNQVIQSQNNYTKTLKENIDARNRLKTSMASYLKDQKDDLQLLKSGSISRQEYNKRLIDSTVKIEQYKNRVAELNKEIKTQTATGTQRAAALKKEEKDVADLSNDYKQLSLAYNEAALKAKNYALQLGSTHPLTIEAQKDALALGNKLKEVDASVGQNQRNVGNYANSIGGLFSKAFAGLRNIANILPGLGLSGVFLAMFEAIRFVVKELGLFNDALFTTKKQRELLNDINEKAADNAAKEASELKVLREIIESTEQPMANRLQAVKDLQKLQPENFGNLSTEALLTGKVGDAYDKATAAILRKARASAAGSELEKISAEKFKLEQRAQDIKEQSDAEIRKAEARSSTITGGGLGVGGTTVNVDKAGVQREIRDRNNALIKGIQEEFDILKKREAFVLKIAAENTDKQVKTEEEKTKKVKAVKVKGAKDEIDAEFEIYKINQQRLIDFLNTDVDDEKKGHELRLNALQNYLAARLQLIDREQAQELKKASPKEALVIEAKFNDERIRLAADVNARLLQLQDEFSKDQLKQATIISSKALELIKKNIKDQEDIDRKRANDLLKREEEIAARKKELYKQLYAEIQSTVFKFLDDGLKREENDLDEKKRLLDEDTKRRIYNINQLGLTEVERVKQTAAVEKNAQFQTEQIEKRKRAIAVERAKFEKAASIASIIASTAQAVVANLKVGPPQGFVLAALAGAIGALQLAKAISTPLPKYKVGTDNAKKGAAIYGEEGRELVIPRQGDPYLSPGVPTLTSLMGGEKIIPADITASILNAAGMHRLAGMDPRQPITTDSVNNHLMSKMLGELKDLNRKSRIIIKNSAGIETSAWYSQHIKN